MDIKQTLQQAVSYHRLGELLKAERLYRKILSEEPKQSDANHNLGVLFKQSNQLESALSLFKTALAANPSQSQYWISCIDILIHLKQYDVAHTVLKQGQAQGLTGEKVDQLISRINLQQHQGSVFKENKMGLPQSELDSVVALYSKGKIKEALVALEFLTTDYPNEALLYNMTGACYTKFDQIDKAIICYKKAVDIKPDYAEAYNNLGITFKRRGQLNCALKSFNQALMIKPDYAEGHYNLGNTLKEINHLDMAVKSYKQALTIQPNHAKAHNNLGITYQELDQLDEAVKSYKKALNIKPDFAEVYNNLGNTLKELGQLDDAVYFFEQAIKIIPNYTDAKWNLSLVQLLTGKYKEGWENYEWRWKKNDFETERHYSQPMWDGSSLKDKTLFIFCEQGAGDAIQCIRYVKYLQLKVKKIIVECPKNLHRLFLTLPDITILVTTEDKLLNFDFYIPLLSLPRVLKTTLETIPSNIPYIFSDSRFASLIVTNPNLLNIGIVWAGNPNHKNDKNRSIELHLFSSLFDIETIQLYSLQVGNSKNDLKEQSLLIDIIDTSKHITDYDDTAAIINQLDLIITVDTSVAHLAGAMGKPVWLILPFIPDWRWLLNRNDSPWYPTVRLFRQKEVSNWAEVFREIYKALKTYRAEYKTQGDSVQSSKKYPEVK